MLTGLYIFELVFKTLDSNKQSNASYGALPIDIICVAFTSLGKLGGSSQKFFGVGVCILVRRIK
jgi:hypothetical protein